MPREFDDWRMARDDLPRYLEMVAEARAAHPGFEILLGLEVDFLPGLEPWIDELARFADWDYLIGGVHYITESWDVDNPKWLGSGRWERQSIDEVWRMYFAGVRTLTSIRVVRFPCASRPGQKIRPPPGGRPAAVL